MAFPSFCFTTCLARMLVWRWSAGDAQPAVRARWMARLTVFGAAACLAAREIGQEVGLATWMATGLATYRGRVCRQGR